ncbi:MAG: class I SAM-dependent methyltransferase [Oligoflexus sp.]
MSIYSSHILPGFIDVFMSGKVFEKQRQTVLMGLQGIVLEVGIGSGLSLPFYPTSVEKIMAVEPAQSARNIAANRAKNLGINLEFIGESAEAIPLPDQSVDFIVSTWTLCTIPDLEKALSEMRRVLKDSGEFHFVEHGRASDLKVAKWQDRLTPIQKLIGGGCHLNRKIDDAISSAGFNIKQLDQFYIPGPKFAAYHYVGRASRNASV